MWRKNQGYFCNQCNHAFNLKCFFIKFDWHDEFTLGTFESGLFPWLLADFWQWNADIRIFICSCNRFSLFHNKVFAELISWIATLSWSITKPFLLISYCSRGTFYITWFFYPLMEPASTYQPFYQTSCTSPSLWPGTQLFGALVQYPVSTYMFCTTWNSNL